MTAAVAAIAALLLVACGHPPATKTPRVAAKTADIVDGNVEAAVAAVGDGNVTLVDFWADWCAACVVVAGHVAVEIAPDDRIVVRKVDVGDATGPVARAYKVSALPHWHVYDKHGRLRYVLLGNHVLRAPRLAKQLLAEP